MRAEHACWNHEFGGDLVYAHQMETVIVEDLGDAGKQVIVAAAIKPREPRQEPERGPIQAKIQELGTEHGADQNEIMHPVLAGELDARPERAERHPLVGKS